METILKFNLIVFRVKLMNYLIYFKGGIILYYYIYKENVTQRVILWIIHIKLLVSLSVKEKDKRLKPIGLEFWPI